MIQSWKISLLVILIHSYFIGFVVYIDAAPHTVGCSWNLKVYDIIGIIFFLPHEIIFSYFERLIETNRWLYGYIAIFLTLPISYLYSYFLFQYYYRRPIIIYTLSVALFINIIHMINGYSDRVDDYANLNWL